MGELIRKYTCIPEPECKHVNSRMTNTHCSSSSLAPSMLEALPGSLYNKEHDWNVVNGCYGNMFNVVCFNGK